MSDSPKDFSELFESGLGIFFEEVHPPGGPLVREQWGFISCEEIEALSPEERTRLGLEEMYRGCVELGTKAVPE